MKNEVEQLLNQMVSSGFIDAMIVNELSKCLQDTLDDNDTIVCSDPIQSHKLQDLESNIGLCYALMKVLNYYDYYKPFKEERRRLKLHYGHLFDKEEEMMMIKSDN
jgi:hypothetical protein